MRTGQAIDHLPVKELLVTNRAGGLIFIVAVAIAITIGTHFRRTCIV